MKRILWLILAVVLCLCCFSVIAEESIPEEPETGTAEGFTWKVLEDGTAEITGYTGEETDIAIPAEVDGLSVSRIGSWAFEKSAVARVEIPEGITAIGRYAFSECQVLSEIILPESLTSLGDCAFMLCSSLKSLTLPEALAEIGQNPICYCTSLTELYGLEEHPAFFLLDDALYERETRRLIARLCASEERIFEVWDECEIIGDYAFADNKHLVSVVLPESVKTVEDLVFFHCTGLQTVEFPDTVEFIGDAVFAQCIAVRAIAPEDSFAYRWMENAGISVLAAEPEETDTVEAPDPNDESEDAG
ncbi:MAG: leucine-rich repeat domain-containing protein [Clostridia bacterium]|nr:leucine-rich repeat domain-containing protein [Clostridia bacterium]